MKLMRKVYRLARQIFGLVDWSRSSPQGQVLLFISTLPKLYHLDIDECITSGKGPCDENVTCTNALGSFVCSCNRGYTGDELKCVSAS